MSFEAHVSDSLGMPLAGVVGDGPAMREVYRLTRFVAPTQATVLVVGETGTGKELIARAVHQLSTRKDGPYVRVNCGALSESLLESELFGHVKGAFTGAVDNKTGRFEAAHTGTLFLDEISSMSFKLQVKLLRVLQDHEFERVGESRTIRVDTRVVAASNQLLEDEVEQGRFRDDLYYRLNVVPIYLPPLRERKEDIPALAEFFLQRYANENKKTIKGFQPGAFKILLDHDWPGNVRELENDVERAVVLCQAEWITEALLQAQIRGHRRLRLARERDPDLASLVQRLVASGMKAHGQEENPRLFERLVGGVERELIQQVLLDCEHVQVKAAAKLGINRNTFHKKVVEFGLADEREGK